MRPAHAFVLVLLLLAAPLPAARSDPSPATATLVADAGSSQAVASGPILLQGRAFGGVEPYSYEWAHDGSGARFTPAAAAATSFDTTGLSGAVTVTLTVLDAHGILATDDVKLHVGATEVALVSQPFTLNGGAPDEEILLNPVDRKDVAFTVPHGATRLTAALAWSDATNPFGNDLDLELMKPNGQSADRNQGRTTANPERMDVPAAPGAWIARIEPYLTIPTSGRLWINATAGVVMPQVYIDTPAILGQDDALYLRALPTAGAAPFTFEWDVDLDGIYEIAGQFGNTSIPDGEHRTRVRVTDANGYRVIAERAYQVNPVDRVLRAICGNDDVFPTWAMEHSASRGTCWLHGGHHTYYFGNHSYGLRRVVGIAFSVEQQFAPPTSLAANATATPVHVQTSMDGVTWADAGNGSYKFLTTTPIDLPERQYVEFDIAGAGQPFRFVRVHNPLSATQGLSGYLDHTALYLDADDLGFVPAVPVAPETRTLACEEDIMEDFFDTHPCWFGGIDRYDSASFFHTYPVGHGAVLANVSGTFTLAPFRHDDWWVVPGLLPSQLARGETPDPAGATPTAAYLQTSVDGREWTTVATLNATFGVPQAFSVSLGGEPATFVRLFPEYHELYDDHATYPALHHTRGYFVDSRLTVSGALPQA